MSLSPDPRPHGRRRASSLSPASSPVGQHTAAALCQERHGPIVSPRLTWANTCKSVPKVGVPGPS